MNISTIIIGQEVICPDGVGRVEEILNDFPHEWVKVQTYIKNRSCCWAPHNVTINGIKCHGKFKQGMG